MHGNELSVVQYTYCGEYLHSVDIYLLYNCIMTFTGQTGWRCVSLQQFYITSPKPVFVQLKVFQLIGGPWALR
jgi:hypothetical protein